MLRLKTPPHLLHALHLTLVEPVAQPIDKRAHMAYAVLQQSRCRHHHISAGHKVLHDVVGGMNAGRRSQRCLYLIIKDGDPEKGQPDLGRPAEIEVNEHL